MLRDLAINREDFENEYWYNRARSVLETIIDEEAYQLPVTLSALLSMTDRGSDDEEHQHDLAHNCGLFERDPDTRTTTPSNQSCDIYWHCASHLSTAVANQRRGAAKIYKPKFYNGVREILRWINLAPTHEGRLTPWEIVIWAILGSADFMSNFEGVVVVNKHLIRKKFNVKESHLALFFDHLRRMVFPRRILRCSNLLDPICASDPIICGDAKSQAMVCASWARQGYNP